MPHNQIAHVFDQDVLTDIVKQLALDANALRPIGGYENVIYEYRADDDLERICDWYSASFGDLIRLLLFEKGVFDACLLDGSPPPDTAVWGRPSYALPVRRRSVFKLTLYEV